MRQPESTTDESPSDLGEPKAEELDWDESCDLTPQIDNISNSIWREFIKTESTESYFEDLQAKIKKSHEKFRGYFETFPPKHQVFNAFECTAFEDVKAVIIAQDPYINPGQAMGLCFSVPQEAHSKLGSKTPPPSLLNIYKELQDDPDVDFEIPETTKSGDLSGDLTSWAEQGVFLLNRALTVRRGKSSSHAKFGWHTFTERVIKKIASERKNVVFMLWGNQAKSVKKWINKDRGHLILETVHPSPLSASRGWFGCRHFSKCNKYLEKNGIEPIQWNRGIVER